MARKIYKTALGREVDIQQIISQNETAIAVGNMKVNARGDELGPGGQVIRSKQDVMASYYKLNTPMVQDSMAEAGLMVDNGQPSQVVDSSLAVLEQEDVVPVAPAETRPLRGSFASSVAGKTTVEQTEMTPANKTKGVQRF
jgi:hypothetical protein